MDRTPLFSGHLLGSAVNSDGRSASFTAPSGRAQEEAGGMFRDDSNRVDVAINP